MTNKYMKAIAKGFNWNPDWDLKQNESLSIDKGLIVKVTKQYLVDNKFSGTAYESLFGKAPEYEGKMPLGNCLLLIAGRISLGEFNDVIAAPLLNGRYTYALDCGEDWVEQVREVSSELFAMNSKSTADGDSLEDVIETLRTVKEETYGSAIDKLLTTNSLMSTTQMVDILEKTGAALGDMSELAGLRQALDEAEKSIKSLSSQVLTATSMPVVKVEASGEIPEGNVTQRKASELFPIKFETDFEVPYFEWEGDHPHVPEVDENYVFRHDELSAVLYAIVTNQRAYLQGHTGSGKTTLIEQVAAHLKWPFLRINFDSEISRMDLIGRDTLTQEDGKTISKFVDGILPKAMSGPYLTCFDEIDFVRPDVAYVMQSALEGNQLRITEDGDRVITPDPMFRMFGTGNTVGQGDEDGMYSGARPQSLAFLDRFAVWIKVDYLSEDQREQLIKAHFPSLKDSDRKIITKYVTEHLNAFLDNKVSLPISPRGMLAIARATLYLHDVKKALVFTVKNRSNSNDYATIGGIIDRVC